MRIHQLLACALVANLLAGCSAPSPSQPTSVEGKATRDANDSTMESGLIEYESAHDFAQTVERLRAGIESRPLTLFAQVDHAKGASNVDLELAPSTLFIFGNPKGGTPLMAKEPRMGIALPLKMHVYEIDGKVMLSHEDLTVLVSRYGLDPKEQPAPNISDVLAGLAAEVTQ